MKSINRRALAALVFGLLTLGASASLAQKPVKARSCCEAQSCCGSECCAGKSRVSSVNNQMSQWYKTKFGREYPGTRSGTPAASHDCCAPCC